MKILCAFGEYNYGKENRGHSYEFSNFIPGLKYLGHEVVFLDVLGRDKYASFTELNNEFINAVIREKPDIILFSLMWYEIWLDTIELINKYSNVITINWYADDSWKYKEFTRLNATYFDYGMSTYDDIYSLTKKNNISNIHLSQWAANPYELNEPLPGNKCKFQVSFVGAAYGNRPKIISALRQKGIDVNCFGYGWPAGAITATEINDVFRNSVISLNFSESSLTFHSVIPKRVSQIKARTFEVPGAGGFLLTQNATNLDSYYNIGTEIDVFTNIDDLYSKIQYYLSNLDERDRIAKAGYERTKNEHTYDKRFSEMFSRINLDKTLLSLNLVDNDRNHDQMKSDFDAIKLNHKVTYLNKIFKKITIVIFSLLFGKSRGERAARRFVFEISWRLFGVKTYKSSGLPGKLFYKQS